MTLTHRVLDKPFHIYRSSAGSGKTRTLAREYIALALRHPDYFHYILAVTFANKASQEMKDRVVNYLVDFKNGSDEKLSLELQRELNVSGEELRDRSKDVLTRILHQYSQFSISTIDAFFQRVIRSFTRESGLLGNFRLEADNDLVLNEVIAGLMDELGDSNRQLTDWVIQFSRERLTEGESWNITDALKGFSKEIFTDNFKAIEEDIQRVRQTISLRDFRISLGKEKSRFLDFMKSRAIKALEILASAGITSDDFNYKESGTAIKYFKEFASEKYMEVKPRLEGSAADPGEWPHKSSRRQMELKKLAEEKLMPLLNEMIQFDKKNLLAFNSADLVEKNFYSYGLISDILRKLKDYQAENNMMLLSDASHFLNGVISKSDTPFIYEKVGSFYRHYLIDEFQDTSELQWKNFQPLLRESLDQNNKSLVVGDVKQSIYRWRGSDQELLQVVVERELGTGRTEKYLLKENWRSAENLVKFNNELFSLAARRVSKATEASQPMDAFQDVQQDPVRHKGKGFIQIQFLEKWEGREDEAGEALALRQVPLFLEQLQSKGIPLGDIAILVRTNEEGQRIATHLLQFKNSVNAKKEFSYDVVSNEALRLDAASSVLLLVAALKHLSNPLDAIALGELVYEYRNRTGSLTPDEAERSFGLSGKGKTPGLLPEGFVHHTNSLVKLPLFELTETLIRIFQLGLSENELAYLLSFQDLILEFANQEKNDIASFLEWWEGIKDKRSIQISSGVNAASIYTIHKAKGLQFKYVIIPFCSWSMNHDFPPLLWCKCSVKPFDQLEYLAVRYTSKLEKSFFADDYRRELIKVHLDNLNLLYVAFTRAEEGMIVVAPKPSQKKEESSKIGNVGQLVYETIFQSPDLERDFDPSRAVFLRGEMEKLNAPASQLGFIPVALKHYLSADWRKKLVIRREGMEFFEEEKSQQRQRINYGILMHKALSRIHYKGEAEDVLKKMNFEGLIMQDEALHFREKINSMMNHPVIGNWFSKEWNVRTEAPVIIPNGQTGRLDRVIWKEVLKKGKLEKKAVIIDFKTGDRKNEDRRQVEQYAQLLSTMGYVDVEGYLLYLDSLETVWVVDKMNLGLF